MSAEDYISGYGYGYGLSYGLGSGSGDGRREGYIFRDGLAEKLDGQIVVFKTREGHIVASYKSEGKQRYFVTLAGTHWCAHGSTIAEAVADAKWKDPEQRPSLEALKAEIQAAGPDRPIMIQEFRILTGACIEGCKIALKRAGLEGVTEMRAADIRDKVSKEWGQKLIDILEWEF